MVSKYLRMFIDTVQWGTLEYLILDLPPGTGDTQLTLAQSFPLSGAVIVTTPQEVSLKIARRGLRIFVPFVPKHARERVVQKRRIAGSSEQPPLAQARSDRQQTAERSARGGFVDDGTHAECLRDRGIEIRADGEHDLVAQRAQCAHDAFEDRAPVQRYVELSGKARRPAAGEHDDGKPVASGVTLRRDDAPRRTSRNR